MKAKTQSILTAIAAMLSAWEPACAQQLAEPTDYSPAETASIRTLRIEKEGRRSRVVVAIGNHSTAAFNANYACTLLDKSGNLIDETGGAVNAVPPGQQVVSKSISFTVPAAKAACRIEFITAAR